MSKKVKETSPTEVELEDALGGLDYVGIQCAVWHLTKTGIESIPLVDESLRNTLLNGLIESALLFVRKTVEFIKPWGKNDRLDNIYAYQYLGYLGSKHMLNEDTDYAELHKRVGHVTIAEIRHGKRNWQLDHWVSLCLDKWIEFFEAMSVIPSALNPERARQCRKNVERLQKVKSCVEEQITNRAVTT